MKNPKRNPNAADQQGVCPCCGSKELDYQGQCLDGDSIGYEWRCKCGASGVEWYDMIFAQHILKGE